MIKVGIFWAVPDKVFGQTVLEVHKSFNINEADVNGFINYPYSHYEVWDDEVKGLGDDCYRYPRGRVIFDVNKNKHLIYADNCINTETIEEIVEISDINDYELCRDEHYVCRHCEKRR